MTLLLALSMVAAAPQQAAQPAPAAPLVQRASARASVRIVKPFRLVAGDMREVEGASRRTTQVSDRDGQLRQATLVEFE
ncbi:hypothetical protein [Sphingomicrobium lutaoense]|uniref:Uncharacterized protein n=1 Tax=Sphingomicrobium lutaoense TaxID=515949 RepID=A0A839Z402_9SPHN|nr:hypothetical protein [Sphingomicrobium lutaoense]MBB3764817.1 hypothetical protein [Sphingomicrobium lutaoense]